DAVNFPDGSGSPAVNDIPGLSLQRVRLSGSTALTLSGTGLALTGDASGDVVLDSPGGALNTILFDVTTAGNVNWNIGLGASSAITGAWSGSTLTLRGGGILRLANPSIVATIFCTGGQFLVQTAVLSPFVIRSGDPGPGILSGNGTVAGIAVDGGG